MPLNIDFQQILLHMLNFVILFAVLYFLLYKPVKKFMDDREAEYKKASDEAAMKLKKAEDALGSLDNELAAKEKEAAEKRSAMLSEAQDQYNRKISDAERAAAKILEDAGVQAEAIRKKAVEQSGEDISQLVIVSVKKAVLNSEEAFDAFLDDVEKDAEDEY